MIADLPVEIIQAIFLESCLLPAVFPLCRNEPRLLVTRVCSRWRAIALATPALWADFFIHALDSHSPPQQDPIRAWISRAAQSTLSFAFRLQSITVVVQLENNVQEAIPTPSTTAAAFQTRPQLHTFALATIGRHPENLRILNFNVPWHQLTILRLYSPSIHACECLDVLHVCISLQDCGISVSFINDVTLQRILERSRCPIVLPFLDTLFIEFLDLDNSSNGCFLHSLCLPRLRKFQPRGLIFGASWPLSLFQPVLCHTIQEPDLSGFTFPEHLPETLALMPNLDTLQLRDNGPEHPGIMHALGEGTLSPRLATLELGRVESWDLLFSTLEARMTAACADSSITAIMDVTVVDRGDGPLDGARLIALRETGMHIRFITK